ncbi:Bug family tripartite tricarboxylate transporter substrate binding protein [Oryzicola mucosus]|uniref:Tripartite tricarboxylate transporter substrate binding protein n=1 Tax=Oryzicola mucosus TaxID=2767425 RepID=A0A8J6U3I3_9HYPH|nr:tripartite tricarboxylate transporter substrate binding protein [Oryzicola mucosus]MBD0416743.1 tripartite tricarboxylate transporter substrate binding protein [Oryzicola mucosus]
MRFLTTALMTSVLSVTCAISAQAQDWPAKPVTIIGGGAPGGPVEMVVRGFSEPLSKMLNQQFVIESKPGAGGNIANEFVSRSAPDGYTFGMTSVAPHGIGPTLYKKLSYDPANFTFVARIAGFPNVIYVPKDSPYNSLADLVKAAKENPGEISQGSIGVGSSTQMIGVLLMQNSGTQISHIPFKGSAPLMNAIMSGELDVAVDNLPGALGQIKAGAVKALAVTTKTRSRQLPDVPTVAESGYPDFDVTSWYALIGPKGIPDDILAKISSEIKTILASKEAEDYYGKMGAEIIYQLPADFQAFVQAEMTRWAPIVKASGATVD